MTNKHIELPAQAPERIWTCKIGGPAPQFSTGADLPMRNAVREAFALLTGADPEFIFSGWGGELTEPERAVVENRLPSPEYEAAHSTPKLDDIEQYRMQMAGISTAALGYWKEGDEIHPDYDTVPLRDVAKLYAKYDELFQAEQQRVLAEQAGAVVTDAMRRAGAEAARRHMEETGGNSPDVIFQAMLAAQQNEPAPQEAQADTLETLRRARQYVLHASTSYYDGTDGAATRQSARNLLKQIDEALAAPVAQPATEPDKWIVDVHNTAQGMVLNPEWIKLHNDTKIVEATEQAEAPSDMVLVPKRMTKAMSYAVEQEGWEWEDLLAAAEAITEAEYNELATQPTASSAGELGWIKPADQLPEDETVVVAMRKGMLTLAEIRWEHPGFEDSYQSFRFWCEPDEHWISDDGLDDGVDCWMPLRAALASKPAEPVAPPEREALHDKQVEKFMYRMIENGFLPEHPDYDADMKRARHVLELSATTPAPAGQISQAAQDVLAERQRQVTVEGWTPEHDDEHKNGAMALGAASYAMAYAGDWADNNLHWRKRYRETAEAMWPWDREWWKPATTDPRRNLVKAGALILAEIERLDRAARGDEVKS